MKRTISGDLAAPAGVGDDLGQELRGLSGGPHADGRPLRRSLSEASLDPACSWTRPAAVPGASAARRPGTGGRFLAGPLRRHLSLDHLEPVDIETATVSGR
jgi:hypothetical protein